jgi:hypothetical protein
MNPASAVEGVIPSGAVLQAERGISEQMSLTHEPQRLFLE